MGKVIRISDLNLSGDNIGQVTPAGPSATFTRLQYLQSSGTTAPTYKDGAYIDTGIPIKGTIQIDAIVTIASSWGESGLMGGDTAFNSSAIVALASSNRIYLCVGSTYKDRASLSAGSYHFKLGNGLIYLANSTDTTVIFNQGCSVGFEGTSTVYLFGASRNGELNGTFDCKFEKAKIYDGNELLMDLVPARRDSDGELGMLDTLTNLFFTNSGGGEFIAGPDVN